MGESRNGNTGLSGRLAENLRRFGENLAESVMPFWAGNAWDHEYGGFLTRLDRIGRRLESREKFLMMQVRMLASLSWAHGFGLTDSGYLDLADRTFDFLVNHFRDSEDGGLYFSVTREGAPLSRRKNTDVHAYAITGLAAYYRISKRTEALDRAVELFDVLQKQAADDDLGYIEDFDGGHWPALNAEQMNLGDQRAVKTIDMHTNVLEGFAYLAEATNDERHLDALRRVLELILAKGLDPEHGCTITAFDSAWTPISDYRTWWAQAELLNALVDMIELTGETRYLRALLAECDWIWAFQIDREYGDWYAEVDPGTKRPVARAGTRAVGLACSGPPVRSER